MDEARRVEPVGVDLQDAPVPAPGEGGVVLEEGERLVDGRLVRGEHGRRDCLVAERPEHRDGLRRREREGEARDGALILGRERPAEGSPGARVAAVAEEALERLGRDHLPGDPERFRTAPEEATGVLGTGRVVVLAAGADLLGVVTPRQRRHLRQAHHGRDASLARRTLGAAVSRTSVSVERREGAGKKRILKWTVVVRGG